jgi:PEP-CTERM motif
MSRFAVGPLSLVGFLLLAVSTADASPVSYAFTGTFQQPFDGSTQFSGTLVYNTNLPAYPGIQPSPGWSYYSGVPTDPSAPVSSLTFQIGNTSSSSFGSLNNLEVIVAHTQGSDGFFLQEQFLGPSGSFLTAELGMANDNRVQGGPFASSALPASLNLSDFSIGADLTLNGQDASGQGFNVVGTITSLTPIGQVPEPSTGLVFAVLGAGLVGLHRAAMRLRTSSRS